ncbi:MAG TPA: hypothetical protein VGJ14_03350 [Sporichthyaceae bacterium]|jgi:hypothetical protein
MVAELTRSYLNFATDNGNRHDVGTFVMIAGPVLIAVLAVYFVYNVVAAAAHGVRTVGGFAVRLVRPVAAARVVTLPVLPADPETATIYIATSAA